MKKIIAIILSISIVFCFCSCSANNNIETTHNGISDDVHIENAEKVMQDFFATKEYDLSELVYKGFIEISDKTYIEYTIKNTPKKHYYVAIEENYNVYTSFDTSEMRKVWYNNIETSETETTTTYVSDNTYLPGYESEPLYIELMKYENCTDPDELCALLENLYGENISYYFLDYIDGTDEDHKDGYFYEPYDNYIYQFLAFYKADRSVFYPSSDTYIFWGEDSLKTRFIMDESGSYLVSTNEHNYYDDGTDAHFINAWIISDIYLCAHGYINEDDEGKNECKQAAYGIDVYEEFERLLELTI